MNRELVDFMAESQKLQQLRKDAQTFAKSELKLSIRQIINTVLPLIIIWTLGYALSSVSIWWDQGRR